jgi:hypothetical protein
MKNKYYKSGTRRFHHKYPGICVPDSSTIFKFVKEVHSTGSFSDKKYLAECCVNKGHIKQQTQVQVIEEGDYERRMHFCN